MVCLEIVLEYLEFSDLLSAASTNKRLKRAACSVYIQISRQKMVNIKRVKVSKYHLFIIGKDSIVIRHKRTRLQMLRCFGHFINELECCSKTGTYILSYVNEYCSGYLSKLRLVEIPKDNLNVFVKPFSKVEELSIDNCRFNVGKYWLKKHFHK